MEHVQCFASKTRSTEHSITVMCSLHAAPESMQRNTAGFDKQVILLVQMILASSITSMKWLPERNSHCVGVLSLVVFVLLQAVLSPLSSPLDVVVIGLIMTEVV